MPALGFTLQKPFAGPHVVNLHFDGSEARIGAGSRTGSIDHGMIKKRSYESTMRRVNAVQVVRLELHYAYRHIALHRLRDDTYMSYERCCGQWVHDIELVLSTVERGLG